MSQLGSQHRLILSHIFSIYNNYIVSYFILIYTGVKRPGPFGPTRTPRQSTASFLTEKKAPLIG
jgi:hypothetical protein